MSLALCCAAPLSASEATAPARAERRIRLCGDRFLKLALHFGTYTQRRSPAALHAELESVGYFTTPRAIARQENHTPTRLSPVDARALAERFFPSPPGAPSVHRRLFLAAFSYDFARGLHQLARDNNGKVSALQHGESVRLLLSDATETAFAIVEELVPAGRNTAISDSDVDWLATPLLQAGISPSTIRAAIRFLARDKPRQALVRLLTEHARLQHALPRFDDGSGLHSVRGESNFAQLKGAYRAHLLEKGMRSAEVEHFLGFVTEEIAAGRRRPWHELAASYLRGPVETIVNEARAAIAARVAAQREPALEGESGESAAATPENKEGVLAREVDHYLRQLTDASLLVSDNVMAKKLALRGGAELAKELRDEPWRVRTPGAHDLSHPTLRAFQRDIQVSDVRELLRNFLAASRPNSVLTWKEQSADEGRNAGVVIEGRVSSGKLIRVVLAPPLAAIAGWRLVTVMRRADEALPGWRHNAATDEQRAEWDLSQLVMLARNSIVSPPIVSAEARNDLEQLHTGVATALAPIVRGSAFLMPDHTPYWFFQRSPTSPQLHHGRYIYGFIERTMGLHVQVSLVENLEGDRALRIERVLSEGARPF